jgi:endonuclease III
MTALGEQLAAVASFDDHYRADYLDSKTTRAEGDPFEISLLFESVFAGARSQSVSRRYREAAETVLRQHESDIKNRWDSTADGLSDDQLREALVDAGLTNQYDRQMVVDIVTLLGELDGQSITDYVVTELESRAAEEMFDRFQAVQNIGPKKATLYLRDIVVVHDLEAHIQPDDYRYLFPVDTWVHRVGRRLGIVDTADPDWRANSESLVRACTEQDISPLAFNQGAWYLGANAFDLVIDHVETLAAE